MVTYICNILSTWRVIPVKNFFQSMYETCWNIRNGNELEFDTVEMKSDDPKNPLQIARKLVEFEQ